MQYMICKMCKCKRKAIPSLKAIRTRLRTQLCLMAPVPAS